jgi:hypothetical protein
LTSFVSEANTYSEYIRYIAMSNESNDEVDVIGLIKSQLMVSHTVR